MGQYLFGVDVGGTTVKLGLFNPDGDVIDKWELISSGGCLLNIREKYDSERVELTLMIGGKNQVSTNPKTSLKTNPKTILKKGQKTREEIIRIIKGNPAVSASEIAVSCKLTKAGIKYHLAILREQGILSHSPEKNGGYWIVNE